MDDNDDNEYQQYRQYQQYPRFFDGPGRSRRGINEPTSELFIDVWIF